MIAGSVKITGDAQRYDFVDGNVNYQVVIKGGHFRAYVDYYVFNDHALANASSVYMFDASKGTRSEVRLDMKNMVITIEEKEGKFHAIKSFKCDTLEIRG